MSDTSITANGKTYDVVKYLMNETDSNRSMIHYYTPELGFFAITPKNWTALRILQTSNMDKNKEIKAVIHKVVPGRYLLSNF